MLRKRFIITMLAIAAFTGATELRSQEQEQELSQQPQQLLQNQQQAIQDQKQETPEQTVLRPPRDQEERDRYQERQRATTAQSQSGVTIQEALVKKLQKTNEAQIELAKLAQQKADHPSIKQFAQTVIQDHEQLNKQLEQLGGQQQPTAENRIRRQARNSDRPARDSDRFAQGEDRTARDSDRTARDSDRTARDSDRTARDSDRTGRDSDRTARRDNRSERANADPFTTNRSSRSQPETVPQELCQIMEQASDNALQMTKEMLSGKEGQNFQMAYLGHQIVAHTIMLADLKAIESSGPQELQPVVQQAVNKTQEHLEQAKQLAQKFQDEG